MPHDTSAPEGSPVPTPDPSGLAEGPSVFVGSMTNLVGLLAGSAFGWLSGIVTANAIGPAGVGVLAVAFGVTEFGRALSNFTHSPSILEYYRNRGTAAVFGTSLALKAIGTGLFMLLALALTPFLSGAFGVPWWSIPLGSSALLVGIFYEIGSARFEAEHKLALRNILLAAGPFAGLGAVLALAFAGRLTVFTSMLTTIFAIAVMSVGFAIAWRSPWRLRFDRGIARYYVTYGSALVASTFLTQALVWTDTLMLAWLEGPAATGLYNVVFQITFVMVTASAAIGVALLPAMSRLASEGHNTAPAYQRGTLLALALSLVLSLVYIFGGRLLLRLYGPEFVAGYPALLVLTVFGIAGALAVPASTVLTVHGRARTLTAIAAVLAIVNVVVNYALIRSFGLMGAATATTLIFVAGTIAMWVFAHRVTGAWPIGRQTFREGAALVAGWARRRGGG